LSYASADDNGISLSQTPADGDPLTINGAYASGGVATLQLPAAVTLTSGDDVSASTFTVTGTDADGNVISEDIAGPNNATTTGLLLFATVTEILCTGGTYTTEEVSAGADDVGLGPTDWWPLDIYTPNQVTTISCNILASGTANYDVEYTNEDPFDTSITQLAVAHPAAALTGATADQTAFTTTLMRAVRVNINSGAGDLRVTVVQQSTR
jgi:hypothetical protein